MADDLEAFLRQAAQRRAQRQAPPQRPAAPAQRPAAAPRPALTARPAEPTAPPPAAARAPASGTAVNPAPQPEVVEAEVVEARQISRVGTRVNTTGFQRRAAQFGEEVGLADEHMDAHIAQRFDHQVGSLDLGDSAHAAAGAGETAYDLQELIAMLQDPLTLRHAVVLSEILRRPQFNP